MAKSLNYWTAQETEVLVESILQKQDVINGAYSSTVTKKSKKQAWEEVVAAVSSECPHATPKTLKDARKKWSNTLCEVRKAIGLYKKSIRGTGGGNPFILKPLYAKILDRHYGFSNLLLAGNEISGVQVDDHSASETSEEFNDIFDSVSISPDDCQPHPGNSRHSAGNEETLPSTNRSTNKPLSLKQLHYKAKKIAMAANSKRLMKERFDLLLSIMEVRAKNSLPAVEISDYPEDMKNYLTNIKEFL